MLNINLIHLVYKCSFIRGNVVASNIFLYKVITPRNNFFKAQLLYTVWKLCFLSKPRQICQISEIYCL